MPSTPERQPSSSLGPLTPAASAALLVDLHAVLSRRVPPAAATALIAPLQSALTTPGSVSPDDLVRAFEQLEDTLEFVLFPPTPAPAA